MPKVRKEILFIHLKLVDIKCFKILNGLKVTVSISINLVIGLFKSYFELYLTSDALY